MISTQLRCCLLVLVVVCYASAFRARVGSGSYRLPQIGRYPAPTPTFPGRNHGLPPVYHGKFKRSIDEELVSAVEGDGGVLALEDSPEFAREARSANDFEAPAVHSEDYYPESFREKRATGYRFILPTYRPPRTSRPRIYYA